MPNPNEMFDVVDVDDHVIGQATRGEVHAQGLLHRAIHIFVFDSQGRLIIQKRSADMDTYPLRYTSSTAGHLGAGEDYDEAAPRELSEELGLSTDIERVAKFAACEVLGNEHTVLYRAVTDEQPTFDPGEVDSIEYCELADIRQRIETTPEQFAPSFAYLLNWYSENIAGIK